MRWACAGAQGDGINLLFTGHMDTSYDGDEEYLQGEGFKAKGVYRDGWIWGLGANNMKSGLASALVAVEAIHREGIELKGDLLFGGVVGETEKAPVDEFKGDAVAGYGVGTRYMVLHGITGDYSILAEPTGLKVCTANMGAISAKISVGGTVSHALLAQSRRGERDRGHARVADPHREVDRGIRSGTPLHGRAPQRHGGSDPRRHAVTLARNPFECSLYLDIRSTSPGRLPMRSSAHCARH